MKPNGKDPLPEHNWVWSPQGAVNMHMPERWGYVQFSSAAAGTSSDAFTEDPNDLFKWALRRLYYRQRRVRETTGKYATTLSALGADGARAIRIEGYDFRPTIEATPSLYEITANGFDNLVVHISQDGRVWTTR
jgi:hypothetical protein